jgi:hypothetical protein
MEFKVSVCGSCYISLTTLSLHGFELKMIKLFRTSLQLHHSFLIDACVFVFASVRISGNIVPDYGVDDRGSISSRGKEFFFFPLCPDWLWACPASCLVGIWGPFPGSEVQLGYDANHSPLTSTEVKNEQELYLLSPKVLNSV